MNINFNVLKMRVFFQVSAHGDITVQVHSVTKNGDGARESFILITKTAMTESVFDDRHLSFKGTSLDIITSVVRLVFQKVQRSISKITFTNVS